MGILPSTSGSVWLRGWAWDSTFNWKQLTSVWGKKRDVSWWRHIKFGFAEVIFILSTSCHWGSQQWKFILCGFILAHHNPPETLVQAATSASSATCPVMWRAVFQPKETMTLGITWAVTIVALGHPSTILQLRHVSKAHACYAHACLIY